MEEETEVICIIIISLFCVVSYQDRSLTKVIIFMCRDSSGKSDLFIAADANDFISQI